MRLQASYENLSDVPAEYKDAFTETDGKAVFSGGEFEFKTETDVSTMKTAKDRANNDLSEAKTKLKAFDGIEPEKHREMLNELDVLRVKVKDGGSDEEEIAEIVKVRIARATEELSTSNAALKTENDDLKGFKVKTEKQTVLDKELSKHVSKDTLSDARFIIGSAIERQADGTYMSNGTAGFEKGLTVEKLVAKAMESRPHWKKKNTPGHGGSGASGGDVASKITQLNTLLEKRKAGKASRTDIKQMITLAAEIKAEQKKEPKE